MERFGKRLQRIREEKGWSREELAQRAKMHYETIYRVEKGIHSEPRLRMAKALARALGVSLDVLAGLYEEDTHDSPLAR